LEQGEVSLLTYGVLSLTQDATSRNRSVGLSFFLAFLVLITILVAMIRRSRPGRIQGELHSTWSSRSATWAGILH